MIILYGSHGYIGSVFARELTRRGITWHAGNREQVPSQVLSYVKPTTVINCAAFIPPQSVKLCDEYPECTIEGNVQLPTRLVDACLAMGFTLAHISTGCLWSDELEHSEDDPPTRGFGGHCGMYIGTKLMAERIVSTMMKHYIFRLRLPFDEYDHPRNYLRKLADYDRVFDHCNSVSHRLDFVNACLDLLENKAPFGTYNVVNEGAVDAYDILGVLSAMGIRTKPEPIFVTGMPGEAKLSIEKLKRAGVKMRTAVEAISESVRNWKK